MKKIILLLLTFILATGLSACNSNTQTPAFLERIDQMSNEELLAEFQIPHAEHVCNINNSFLFKTPLDLSTNSLFLFFVERMDAIDPDYTIRAKWHDSNDNNLHIPVEDIEEILKTYLAEYNFNTEDFPEYDGYYGYDSKSNSIITGTITGWGGRNVGNILSRNRQDNILTLEVEFYSDFLYFGTKTYRMLVEEDGYKFLSVTKKEKLGNSLSDQVNYLNALNNKEIIEYFSLEDLERQTKGEFVFDKPTALSTDLLYRFFDQRLSSDRAAFKDINTWYSADNHWYYVPVTELRCVLDRYLQEYNLELNNYKGYNSTNNLITKSANYCYTPLIDNSGIRGKITKREIEDNILTIEIAFYDPKEYTILKTVDLYDAFDKFEYLYSKAYKILIEENSYKFLSVIDIPQS